jgi:hypothetical protein
VISKIFGLTSEQRPWPWQRLESMDSGNCVPLWSSLIFAYIFT